MMNRRLFFASPLTLLFGGKKKEEKKLDSVTFSNNELSRNVFVLGETVVEIEKDKRYMIFVDPSKVDFEKLDKLNFRDSTGYPFVHFIAYHERI